MRGWRPFGWGLSIALLAGAAGGALTFSSACIIGDKCIVVVTSGQDWCTVVVGAQMWPAGKPDLATPVLDNNKPPIGCSCFNDAEVEISWTEAPLTSTTNSSRTFSKRRARSAM